MRTFLNLIKNRAIILIIIAFSLMLVPYSVSDTVRLGIMGGLGQIKTLFHQQKEQIERQPDEELRARLLDLMQEAESLRERLRAVKNLEFNETKKKYKLLMADVVLRPNPERFDSTIIIAKGQNHGLVTGLAVVFNNILIGRIISVSPWTSRVMLTTDPRLKVGAFVIDNQYDSEPRPRQVGVAMGDVTAIKLKWVSNPEEVEAGHYILTTEDPENNTPKGLVIGKITVIKKLRNSYLNIGVDPVVNPATLEYVFVLKP